MTNNKNNSSPELNDPQGIDRSLLEYLKPKSDFLLQRMWNMFLMSLW